MPEELDENDPFYAFKKWGINYREQDDYWAWRRKRDKERETNTSTPTMTLPKTNRRGW